MTIEEIQPYLTVVTAMFSVTTLGFIVNILKSIRDNAQDRIAIQDERLKRADEELKRTEKWADREKSALKEELDKAKTELDALLQSEGVNLSTLTIGKQLSDAASAVRDTAQKLINEMQQKLVELAKVEKTDDYVREASEWELSLAIGSMAFGAFAEAAEHFDAYSKSDESSWEANFIRGVAHANARGGFDSNVASLRAYNEAIALMPKNIDVDRKARLFGYRGAILKRLDRLSEAESDLKIALSLAKAEYEILDIHYNLSCVYAMRGEKLKMIEELSELKTSSQMRRAVLAHRVDYFKEFANDPDFISVTLLK